LAGTETVRRVVDETTALEAAYAAGLAVDYWDTVDEIRDNWQVDQRSPVDDANIEVNYDRWKDAVERAENWAREE
jgi:glycerol kinase